MKLAFGLALAALAMATSACVDTTTVTGSWRADEFTAGACHTWLASDVHVQIFDTSSVVEDYVGCDELGFSLEIPIDATHVRVSAVDPTGGHWDKSFDIQDGYLNVGTIWFAQDIQPD
ncbi:MAG: hypothetical protein IPQ07_30630 [Myxococcales bacterium]|nr:hypothetical protein [Myxococcales bacterium]